MSNVVDFQHGLLGSSSPRGTQARLHAIASVKLWAMTTPPEEREKGMDPEMAKTPFWRAIMHLDDPMGTPEQIAAVRKEWLETMPPHERIEWISGQVALLPGDERQKTYQEILEKIPDMGPGMIERIEQMRAEQ